MLGFKKTIVASLLCVAVVSNCLASGDYPKTKEERDADEMGSILGEEGIIFKPGKIKNESTRAHLNYVNKYLWQATIEILDFLPLSSVDSNGGVIITDWYSPKNKPNVSFKINVLIKDSLINPDSIEVKVFERVIKDGKWEQIDKKTDLALTLEDKILTRARELYIHHERKEPK